MLMEDREKQTEKAILVRSISRIKELAPA